MIKASNKVDTSCHANLFVVGPVVLETFTPEIDTAYYFQIDKLQAKLDRMIQTGRICPVDLAISWDSYEVCSK